MSLKIVPWISPSALAAFSGCKQQWKWAYAEGYQSMGRNFALDVGSGVHVGLAAFYRDGIEPQEAFGGWVDEQVEKTTQFMDVGGEDIGKALQSDLEQLEDVRELGVGMLKEYMRWFHGDSLEVLAVEQRLERPIPGTDWTLPAIIDAVVRNHAKGGRVYVLEHKTFSRFEEWFLYKDQQFVAEAWVAETLVEDERIAGVIYNGLRKNLPGTTKSNLFERRFIPVNRAQIAFLLKRARGMHKELTAGKISIYPEPSIATCRFCRFKDPCDMLLRGDDYEEYLKLMYTKREDRRYA